MMSELSTRLDQTLSALGTQNVDMSIDIRKLERRVTDLEVVQADRWRPEGP
jgi:hypothetical protein